MDFHLSQARSRYQEMLANFRSSHDESILLAFNELGITMNRAGIPPEIAVETHALALQRLQSDDPDWPSQDNTLLLPLMEVIMAYGVTFRHQMDTQQQNSQAQFYQVLEQSLDIVFITDLDQTITYANPAYCEAMSRSKSSAIGNRHPFVDYPEASSPDDLWRTLAQNQNFKGTITTLDDQHSHRSWAVSAFPLFDPDGQPSHYVLLAEDISRQLILQKRLAQSKRLATIGEMASGVSHEFNNILLIISGFAELIREDGGAASTVQFADEILKAVDKGGNLNKQILSLASDRSHDRKPVRLGTMIERIRPLIRTAVGSAISLDFDCPDDVIVTLNEDHLCQILTNLCINARHAINSKADDTKGAIRCLFQVQAGTLQLSVEDNGTGMSTEVQGEIFDPFFTTKRVGEGSGLGLSIVLRLVDEYHGQIGVNSELGKGTQFHLQLPVLYEHMQSANYTQEHSTND